jgi:hypothetical protein
VYLDYRIAAIFAIANAHDARGEIDTAFAAYDAAHMLSRERDAFEKRSYDAAQDAVRIQRTVNLWERLPEIPPVANAPRPIFIVGMPRSGTTLLEAVLGAHSRVFACGERLAMRQILRWPTSLEQTPPAEYQRKLQDWAKFYFRDLPDAQVRHGADHITDKHPRNFEAAGFITRLLPTAVIVHVRRAPVETCLSIYRPAYRYRGVLRALCAAGRKLGAGAAAGEVHHDPIRGLRRGLRQRRAEVGAGVRSGMGAAVPGVPEDRASDRNVQHGAGRSAVALGNGRAQRYEKFLGPLTAALAAGGIDLRTGALKLRE